MSEQARPKRIQRKRTKGWKMPEGAVYVGRPTRFGNPYYIGDFRGGVRACIAAYREMLMLRDAESDGFISRFIKSELAGKDLACWCQLDQPCHADVLLEIANSEGIDEERF